MSSTTPLTQPHLRVIAACAKTLSTTQPFDARVAQVFVSMRTVMSFDEVRLSYWTDFPTRQGLVHVVGGGTWGIAWDDEMVQACITTQSPQTRDSSAELPARSGSFAARLYTTTCIPIMANNEVYGVFSFRTDSPQPLNVRDLAAIDALIPLFATQLVLLVASTPHSNHDEQLLQAARKQLRIVDIMAQLRTDFDPPIPLHGLLPLILARACEYSGAEYGSIVLVDPDRQEIELIAVHGYQVTPLRSGAVEHIRHRWNWDSGVAGKVARTARPLMLKDAPDDVTYFYTNLPTVRSTLAIPLVVDKRVEAVLCLDSGRVDAFSEHESALALGVAEASAQPLRRAIRYQELLERSTQLNQVFQSIPSGLVLIDRYGQVLRHNPAFLHIWGLTAEQVGVGFRVPFDMLALLLPRFIDSNAFTQFSDNAHSHPDQEFSMSLKLRNPHQELQILSVPTRDNSEHITGRIWVINDTTRETEADRLKSEFASLVSHELKTPLTSIMGYSDILLNRDLPSEAQKNLLRILRSEAENLQSLVHEMLDYARIEANTVRINRWPIAVGELAVDLAKKLQHSVAFANHQIAFDVPPHLPPAYADKDRVRQILTNLISNAAKYSPDGGTITVRVRELANPPARHPDGQFLHISISDEGIGITAENLSRIWDRFVRVDTSNTKSIGGTGLGLTIVKGLVELHGGRAWAHSEINKGSTFHFSLPVATDLAHED